MLRFIVEYQHSYSGVRMVDVEPEHTIAQFSGVIPQMREGLQRHLPGPNAAVKAATVIRIAISHYIVRSDDADQFLAQLRHAVGIKGRCEFSATLNGSHGSNTASSPAQQRALSRTAQSNKTAGLR